MTYPEVATLCILAVMIAMLLWERVQAGLVGLGAAAALVALGVTPISTVVGNFTHDGVASVAGLFIVAAGISRTGALDGLVDWIGRRGFTGGRLLLAVIVPAALFSTILPNTAVVLIFLPLVLAACDRLDVSPSRLLIPLSYASILGGIVTLVGTSTNVVAVAEARAAVQRTFGPGAHLDIGMFTFSPVGVCLAVLGLAYVTWGAPRMLPDRLAMSVPLPDEAATERVTELCVDVQSPWLGRRLGEAFRGGAGAPRILQLVRRGVAMPPAADLRMEIGDRLLVRGEPEAVRDEFGGLTADGARTLDVTLIEGLVGPVSPWAGHRIDTLPLTEAGVAILAVQRGGKHLRENLGYMVLIPGDTLLLQGSVQALRRLRGGEEVVLVGATPRPASVRSKAPIALLTTLAFVITAAVTERVAEPALAAAVLLVLTRCITVQETIAALDWNVLLLLAGALSMGSALQSSGLAFRVAEGVSSLASGQPLWLTVGILYGGTLVLTELLSNGVAAALMVPVAVEAAKAMSYRPEPLVIAVCFAASAGFALPIGYQTHLFVYGSGGYRMRDFVRFGVPLDILMWIAATILIPLLM